MANARRLVWRLRGAGRADAVLASTMASFLVYAAIIMGVFHARTALRAWAGIILAAVPCVLIIGLSKSAGGF